MKNYKLKKMIHEKRERLFARLMLLGFCFLMSSAAFAQGVSSMVKGKVTDDKGVTLIGVSIKVEGTTNGTVTDMDGNFVLNAAPNSQLTISYMGYHSQTVRITDTKKELNIVLLEDNQLLDEVVVVGFGVQKKVNLTGSVAVADRKLIESRPVNNAVSALQGVVPGLNISASGVGTLDSEKSINVRGTTTIGDGSSGAPLVLIDGMEGNLSRINPQDIESISVLKDAAASSIYGSRAPFGVILVTTKSGSDGKTVINYNNSFRYSNPIGMPHLQNSWEWLNYFNDASVNNNGSKSNYFTTKDLNGNYFSDLVKQYFDGNLNAMDTQRPLASGKWNHDYSFGNVDWLNEYYKSVTTSQEHNLSVSGGNKKSNYYLSANFMDQGGLLKKGNDNYQRYAVTGKYAAQLNDVLKMEYTSRFSRVEYDRPTVLNSSFYDNVIRRARPVRPITDPNGNPQNDVNYLGMLENGGRANDKKDEFANQFKLTITPVKNWNIIGELNTKFNNNWYHTDNNIIYTFRADGVTKDRAALSVAKSSVSESVYSAFYLNPNVYSNYHFTLNKVHNFYATTGFQAEKFDTKDFYASRNNMVSGDYPVLDLTNAADLTDIGINGSLNKWRTAGFFGRLNYDFDGKYLVELNGRYDGSSRFRRNSRWVFNPSFSLGWNIARESFFEPLTSHVNMLKARFSYGQLANQNTSSWYPTYVTMNVYPGDGNSWLINGVKPITASAPGLVSSVLTWEKIRSTNYGLDFGFLNSRLTGSFDYFVRNSLDMVGAGVVLPSVLGVGVPKTNNLDLKSYGWELQLSWKDRIKDFSYEATVNISDAQTKVTKYPNETNRLDQYRVGEVTGNIYGFTTLGIAKTQEEMDAHLAVADQSALGSKWGAGDIMYADLNDDGKVDRGENLKDKRGDLEIIGNSTPRFRTGVSINLGWKGVDLQMFWQGVLKQDWAPHPDAILFWGVSQRGEWWSSAFKEHLDYFRGDDTHPLGQNLNSYFARPIMGSSKNQQTQTRFLQDASYMRLKNLQIGYVIPQKLTKKIAIERLRVYASGENMLTFTKLLKVLDPESVGVGQQYGTTYPFTSTYSFGLSVNF